MHSKTSALNLILTYHALYLPARACSPGLPRLARRAMQTLLGFGYLLTVLHEKHIGGQMQFSAAALTAAGSGTPVGGMIDSHRRTLKHQSSSGKLEMACCLRHASNAKSVTYKQLWLVVDWQFAG